ncbi:MAG: F0F1 ATP synthase subunit epsilon [Candidatus Latescibacteria bacterium]|nr:F0F1 ATP synthase subunit epsilon [Candidatus Latescibacterota bacterium]OPX23679.1 MAG: ATP synthase F1 subunit epsilon [Candidatus Latescibacteria bacterium 4484_107]
MADSIQLTVMTPDRVALSEEVERVEVPGSEGYFEVLPKHTPFLTGLKTGQVLYAKDGGEEVLSTNGGFVEVLMDRVTILAETAERAYEIDRQRAEEARQRAERRLEERDAQTDVARAEAALKRALNRLRVAEQAQG